MKWTWITCHTYFIPFTVKSRLNASLDGVTNAHDLSTHNTAARPIQQDKIFLAGQALILWAFVTVPKVEKLFTFIIELVLQETDYIELSACVEPHTSNAGRYQVIWGTDRVCFHVDINGGFLLVEDPHHIHTHQTFLLERASTWSEHLSNTKIDRHRGKFVYRIILSHVDQIAKIT